MKIYRELYFKGTPEQLSKFVKEIGKYAIGDWSLTKEDGELRKYLIFNYNGKDLDKASVYIYLGDKIYTNQIHVVNIVPTIKNELNINEYNNILLKFYEDVIRPYKENGTELDIPRPTNDDFNPTSVISETALKKLKLFCNNANKSTGASHPCDRERWFDFICQTVDDGRLFDSSTLATFLQDEDYWGKKKDGFMGIMGNYAWDKEKAYELANEYENLCEILQYYKEKRGI